MTPAETGSDVKCDSSSEASIDDVLADDEVVDRRNGAGIDRETVVKAVRNAQSQWTNNVNWCGIKDQASPPAHYEGKTSRSAKHDGYSTVDWGSLKDDQGLQRGARVHGDRV